MTDKWNVTDIWSFTDAQILIDDLEAAEVGSRVLDEQIAIYLGWTYSSREMYGKCWRATNGKSFYEPPRYTTSIDAADSLRPDGWTIEVGNINGVWECEIAKKGTAYIEALAKTEPLARCIAALKAIQAEQEEV